MVYRQKHFRGGIPPAQFIVNTAVRTAAKEVNSTFEMVMQYPPRTRKGGIAPEFRHANQARIYAGLALRALFMEQCDDSAIAKFLFVRNVEHWFYQVDHRMRVGDFKKWWNDEKFMRVIEEVERVMRESLKQVAAE